MKSTIEYLNDVAALIGKSTEEELAKVLEVNRSAIGHYRSGRRIMDDSTCLIIAEILGIDPLTCVSSANYEREKNPKKRAKWERIWNELEDKAKKKA